MPTVNVPGVGEVDFPDSMSPQQIVAAIERDIIPNIKPVAPPKEGVGAALIGGTKRAVSSAQTALESILDPEAAARRGLERGEAISREYAPGSNLDKVLQAYKEKGILPAAGEAISQIPGAFAEQAPQIAATLGSARLGAMAGAPFGPVGAIIGGGLGAAAPSLIQQFGSNIERQAEEKQPISRAAAAGAAVPQAALDVIATYVPLGRNIVGKLLGPNVEKALAKGTNEAIERTAKENLSKTLGKGVAIGAGVEGGTEVAQQMLERLQAGLPLTTPDALAEYGQAVYGGALVGGPFGALGRVGERGAARGKVSEQQAEERRLQEQIAGQERKQAEEAEAARKLSPEYRQELNDRLWTLKDELAQIEPIAKDKAQDEDVRNEAIARAKEIKTELKDIQSSIKDIAKATGEAPTLAKELAKGYRQMPVVDEFGNIIKPKTKPLTEEEYGQKLEGAATQWQETQQKIQKLREEEEAAAEAKRQKTYEDTQQGIQNYLAGLQDVEEANIKETAKRVAAEQQRREEDVAQEMTLNRIKLVLDNFGLRAAGVAPEVRKLVESRIDEGVVDRTVTKELGIQGLEGRTYRGEDAAKVLPNIQDTIDKIEEQRQKYMATSKELMDDKGQLTPAGYKLVGNEAKLNELKRLRDVINSRITSETGAETAAAGIIESAAGKADEAVPVEKNLPGVAYENRIKKANQQAGGAFLDLTSYIDDLSAKRYIGGAKGNIQDATKQMLLERVDASKKQVIDNILDEIATARVARKLRPLSKTEAISVAMDIDGLVDMLVTRSLAPAPGMMAETKVTPAQMRGTEIVAGAQEIEIDKRGVRELPFGASAKKAKILSPAEQEKIVKNLKKLRAAERETAERVALLDAEIKQLDESPTSTRTQELITARAEAFEKAKAATQAKEAYKQGIKNDVASTGVTQKQALQAVQNVIRSIKQDTIAEGQRPVRAGEKPLLKKQYASAPTDLIKDLDRVLRMEYLNSNLYDVLEAARRRLETGNASVELEELVEEQVGRILRGTDKPFTHEYFYSRDVTKPAGRRAMDARADIPAALYDELQAQMRYDDDIARAAGEQMTVVPKGREFREERVQPDLFPETVATERATPAMFQRLQKSGVVRKEKAKVAAEKETVKQVKKELRAISEEYTPESIQRKERDLMDRIEILAEQIKNQEGYGEATVKGYRYKWINSKDPKDVAVYKKEKAEWDAATPEQRTKMRVPVHAGSWQVAGQTTVKARQAVMSDRVATQWATLDEDIKKEVAALKKLEAEARKFAKAKERSDAQKRLAKAATQQKALLGKLEAARKDLTQQEKQAQTKVLRVLENAQSGLGLPGVKVSGKTREELFGELLRARKEKKKGEKLKRPSRVKVVPIKSKAELDEELAAQRSEQLDDLRRRAKTATSETVYNKLKEEEKVAVQNAQLKTHALNEFVKAVNKGKAQKNFPKFKKMSAEVDAAKARVKDIRANLRLLAETQYVPESQRKRQPSRGPIGGEVKWYDKKFTPDQLRDMSGMGLSAFDGNKTYSVDDSIDFAIGDKDGGGIDLEEANKRMAEVEAKAKAMGMKVKYFPTMQNVTVDILNDMERQGVDVYTTRIRGGVKPDGTVFVIGENHTDMTDLEKTIGHEFVGHFTFEGLLGPDGMKKLLGRVDKSFESVFKLADTLGVRADADAAYAQGLKFGMTPKDAEVKALREVIAYTMEKRVDQDFLAKAKRWIQELVGALRSAFKKLGVKMDLSTSDLFYMMKQANKAFEEGKPIAYKKSNGDIDYAFSKPKYNAGMEDLGSITDKIIGRQEGKWNSLKANVSGLAGRVQFVDRFAALEELANRGVTKGIIDSLKAQDMMYFARMADQRHSFVAEIANNGGLKLKDVKRPDGRIEKIIESDRGASLKDVSQALLGANVGNAEATGRLFTLYLAAERAQRVGIDKLNFGGGITQADLQKALDFGRSNASFQKARALYNEYNRGLINFAVQTGAISKERGAELNKQGDYIPYYRMQGGVIELMIGSENPIRIGDIKNQPYLEELVGGKEAIMDFFTSSLQNTTLLTDMALRNLATRNAAFTLKDLGIAEIHNGDGPPDRDVIRFHMDDVDKNGKVVHRNKWARINTEAKQELFGDIPSDLVVKGMEGIKIIVPGITRMMGTPANWVRKFVTRDPRYAVRQIFRDSLAATLTTGADIKPVVDTMGEIAKMYGKGSEAFQKLQRRGVLGGQVITGAPEDMAKIMQQIASGKPGWDLAMAKLDQFAMAGDAGTRLAMYNSFLKQGLSEREATLAALESMNFGRRGVSPSMYFLNATIPFFNAGIQGLDVFYRAFRGKMPYDQQLAVKKKFYMRGAMMATLTMAYAAMMQDDEAYKNAEPDQRYGNWFVHIPGLKEPFKVPIPFEVGLLFKAVPEGIYNALFGTEKGEKVAKDLAMQTIRSLPGNLADVGVPMPTALKPFVELATNMSLFTGRDIVDARLEKLDKSMQYRDKTPEIIKLLGQFTHFRVGDTEIGFSPVQLEHITRTLTGSLGIGMASLLNPVLGGKGEAGEVAGRVSDLPIIGGMFQPADAGRVINDAYETIKMLEKKQGTYKELIKEGKIQEAQEYVKNNTTEIGLASFAGSFRQQMGEITKAERAIKAVPEASMSPDQKRERLDQLRQVKIKMAENFRTVREQIERQAAR